MITGAIYLLRTTVFVMGYYSSLDEAHQGAMRFDAEFGNGTVTFDGNSFVSDCKSYWIVELTNDDIDSDVWS